MADKIDTSTAAIEAMLNGVTPGPWAWECESGEWPSHLLVDANGDAVMWFDFDLGFRFSTDGAEKLLEKSRQLVPALAAERDALRAALKRLEYWFDTDAEILAEMTEDDRRNHLEMLETIRAAIGLSSTAVDDRNADQSAINAAFRRGQEDMRARACTAADNYLMVRTGLEVNHVCNVKFAIQSLPIKDKEE